MKLQPEVVDSIYADSEPYVNKGFKSSHNTEDLNQEMAWEDVWLATVSKAWKEPAFRTFLLEDARRAIRTAFDYHLPPGMELYVIDAATLPNGEKYGWKPSQRTVTDADDDPNTWVLPKTVVMMALPPTPAVEEQALALSYFNAMGGEYPFTCFV